MGLLSRVWEPLLPIKPGAGEGDTVELLLGLEGALGQLRRFQEILERMTYHVTFVACIQVPSSWVDFGDCGADLECVLVW